MVDVFVGFLTGMESQTYVRLFTHFAYKISFMEILESISFIVKYKCYVHFGMAGKNAICIM
jgi:hypothetical protein